MLFLGPMFAGVVLTFPPDDAVRGVKDAMDGARASDEGRSWCVSGWLNKRCSSTQTPVNTPATRNTNFSDSNFSDSNRSFMGGSTEQQGRTRPINAIPSPRTEGSASGRRRSYRRWSLSMPSHHRIGDHLVVGRTSTPRLVHVADAAHGVSIPCPGTQRAFFDRRCRCDDARAPAIRVKRARRLRVGE